MLAAWQITLLAGTVLILIALWVRREHGGRAAAVMLGLSAAALACLWVAYEVVPVEQWRKESLPAVDHARGAALRLAAPPLRR